MTIIWLTLMVGFFFSFLARYYAVPNMNSPVFIRPSKFFAYVVAAVIVICSGLRNNIGDTFFYMHSYRVDDLSWLGILQNKDIGFGILQMVLKSYTDDPQILIVVTALITNFLIVMVLYKYARLFDLAVYLYITSGAFIVSMNGIRQYLTAAIIFAATKYILEGSWKKYMLVVLFAALFHQSALILIPIYFIVRRKAWTTASFLMLGLAVLIVLGFNQFSDILFSAIKDTQYGEYQSFSEGGANVFRVAFYALPLVIAFLGREKLRMLFPHIDIIVNLSLIGLLLMIISTQNWIFARLAIYFTLYQIILTTWVVKVFRKKDQKLVFLSFLIIYLIFFFYENVITLGLQYRSDYLKWFL
ncbi:EpsG family protein [Paenibacillus wynnii]|uniref:Capsular biosynthesis protein n=1 Tax=Paenibacillus wynnii TaxID=268407 RepID=A0A098M9W4_9BACL|nr:EpsG family protein [Paenibacillus wynnii]KGE19339.1 capsular biosynthesis protein [Paenibacillus wynnii]